MMQPHAQKCWGIYFCIKSALFISFIHLFQQNVATAAIDFAELHNEPKLQAYAVDIKERAHCGHKLTKLKVRNLCYPLMNKELLSKSYL